MRRETSDGQTERGDLSFGVPQGSAQLHSGRATKGKRLDGQARRLPRPTWQSYAGLPPEEGAKQFGMCHCVPFLLTGIYDHSGHLLLVLRAFCRECANRPKLALSLHIKGPSL